MYAGGVQGVTINILCSFKLVIFIASCGMATGDRDNGNDSSCHQVVLSYSQAYKGIKSQDNPL